VVRATGFIPVASSFGLPVFDRVVFLEAVAALTWSAVLTARAAGRSMRLMETVYLETTFISYLVARPSRDVIVAAHQQVTHDWWAERRTFFDCGISQVVIDEASLDDPSEVQKRLDVVRGLSVLEATQSAEALTQAILVSGAIPPRAARDAAHIAIAAVHGVEYLLTWNCSHLANAQIVRRVARVCEQSSLSMPLICTPEELMGT
jgi:hypothetical protein